MTNGIIIVIACIGGYIGGVMGGLYTVCVLAKWELNRRKKEGK
jgi:hypothetical protein